MQNEENDNDMTRLTPDVSLPGMIGAPASSPVQRALEWLQMFFAAHPRPDINSDRSAKCGMLIAAHLLHLVRGCGMLNAHGFHSCAVSMLRLMEDALDCFAAVTLVRGSTEKWETGRLKASDAAKEWTNSVDWKTPEGISLPDYRKFLRRDFNTFSHCTNELCLWNLRFIPKTIMTDTGITTGTLEPNWGNWVINKNAHSIDAFETAHIFEFIKIIKLAYSSHISLNEKKCKELESFLPDLEKLMIQHNEHHCQEVREPPEIKWLDKGRKENEG